MPSQQLVLFFKDLDGFGWSEKYFYSGPIIAGTVPAPIADLLSTRMGLSTTSITLTHIRLASGVKRDPFVLPVAGGTGIIGTQPIPSEPSEVALLVRFAPAGTTVGFGRVFIRGLPSRVVQEETFTPDSSYTAALNAYLSAVTSTGVFNVQGTLGSPPAHITVGTTLPLIPRGFQAVVTAAPPLVQGQQVRFHAAKVPGYNGLKTVTNVNVAPNTYQFGGAAPAAPDNGAAMYATLVNRYDNVITNGFVEGISRRAAGRPFGQSRGRRSTTYSLRQ